MKWVNVRANWLSAIFFILFVSSGLFAQAGTSGGDFLRISAYSRGSAVGGAWVAVAEGAGALHYNPAGVGRNGAGEFTLTHSALFQDLKLENLSVTYPLRNGSGIGIGVSYLGYGSIEGYDISGSPTGLLSAYSLLLTVAYSQRLTDNLSIGLAVKPVLERLADHSARTVTADLGVIADLGQFSVGAQLANLRGSLTFVNDRVSLPRTLRVGVAYRSLGTGSLISLGGARESDGRYAVCSGVEYRYSHNLTLRAGYGSSLGEQGSASEGFSFGAGLNINPIAFDYSFRPSGTLNSVHQITASYHFGN
jgi:hypothetical protein